jgi:hypothetical protein
VIDQVRRHFGKNYHIIKASLNPGTFEEIMTYVVEPGEQNTSTFESAINLAHPSFYLDQFMFYVISYALGLMNVSFSNFFISALVHPYFKRNKLYDSKI